MQQYGTGGYFVFLRVISDSTQCNTGGALLQQNIFYHVTATFDGSHINMYVNGALTNSCGATGLLAAGKEPLQIGSAANGYYFPGAMDDIRIYNRALSSAEVQQIYQGSL